MNINNLINNCYTVLNIKSITTFLRYTLRFIESPFINNNKMIRTNIPQTVRYKEPFNTDNIIDMITNFDNMKSTYSDTKVDFERDELYIA